MDDHVEDGTGDLRVFVTACFEKSGVPEEDARIAADVLVASDCRGIGSHG